MTQSNFNNIPEELKRHKAWVLWKLVPNPVPGKKPRKVPFYANGDAREGTQGDAEDLAQLATHSEVMAAYLKGGYTGIGFATLPQFKIVALDFDDVVTNGVVRPDVLALCEGTYTEYSPSGNGIRAFFTGTLKSRKDPKAEKGAYPLEVFGDSGFVTFTGNVLSDCVLFGDDNTVAPLSDAVLAEYEKRWGSAIGGTGMVAQSENDRWLLSIGTRKGWSVADARVILADCDPSCDRDHWLKAGMALHHEFDGSDEAFDLYNEWSAKGSSYVDEKDVRGRWRSFGRSHSANQITGVWLEAWRKKCRGDLALVISRLKVLPPDNLLKNWAAKAVHLSRPDAEKLRDFVQQSTGTMKSTLNAELKAARLEAARRSKAEAVARRAGARRLIQHRPEDATEQAYEVEGLIVESSNPGAYVQFAGMVAHVVTKAPRYAHQIDNADCSAPPVLQIERLNSVGVQSHAEQVAVFVAGEDRTPIAVPGSIIKILLEKTEHAAPHVTGIASHPIVLPSGEIIATDGLHNGTGLFLAGAEIGDVSPYSQAVASKALERLRAAIGEGFEFASPLDVEVAVAAFMTALVRRILDQSPGLVVVANTQASGKTTLARRQHVLLTGHDMPVTPFNDDSEAEQKKQLMSALLTNPAMICFDNIKDGYTFRSAPVALAMTSAVFKDRVLGVLEEKECPTNTMFVVTGNNISLGNDEVTRLMVCTLSPSHARPEKRRFNNPDVVAHALSIRRDVIRDAIGIIAGYRSTAAGTIPDCGRFKKWDDMVRQPVMWAGGLDIATVFDRNDEKSEENSAHRGLMLTLREKFKDEWFSAADVVKFASTDLHEHFVGDLHMNLRECLEALRVRDLRSTKSVGHMLKAKQGKAMEIDGASYALKCQPGRTGMLRYQVSAGFAGF